MRLRPTYGYVGTRVTCAARRATGGGAGGAVRGGGLPRRGINAKGPPRAQARGWRCRNHDLRIVTSTQLLGEAAARGSYLAKPYSME